MATRAGRPPRVYVDGNEASVVVKGQKFSFRKGEDGRLRALGNPERTEDFEYARNKVESAISQQVAV